jgi:Luciferase-like monooxygenase
VLAGAQRAYLFDRARRRDDASAAVGQERRPGPASGGKFRLGLGTQVRTHVVRRCGMAFDRPGPRLRDYVLAVKACFAAFRSGTLDHHGEFYDLDFITPQWSAEPIDARDPAVDVAALIRGCCGWPAR